DIARRVRGRQSVPQRRDPRREARVAARRDAVEPGVEVLVAKAALVADLRGPRPADARQHLARGRNEKGAAVLPRMSDTSPPSMRRSGAGVGTPAPASRSTIAVSETAPRRSRSS